MKNCEWLDCKETAPQSTLCSFHALTQGIPALQSSKYDSTFHYFKYYIKESTIPNAGLGLFLSQYSEPICKKSYLWIYSGDIHEIIEEEIDKSDYLFETPSSYFINAKESYNYPGRFINSFHNSEFLPNVQFSKTTAIRFYNKLIISPFYVVADIYPDQEIITNYGNKYFNNNEFS